MNILLVTESFYPDGIGGIHTYVYELARNLSNLGHGVYVMTPRFDKRYPREEKLGEINIFRYRSASQGALLFIRRPILSIFNSFFLFKKLRKTNSFNIVNFHSSLPAFGINLLCRRITKIYTFHASMYQEVVIQSRRKKYTILSPISLILCIIKFIEKINLRYSDKIIVLSEFNKKQLLKLYKKIDISKIKVIPGGVDPEEYKPADDKRQRRIELNLPEDKIVLFSARRLVARMGLENLIYAFSKIKEEISDIILIIAGEGFLKDKLDYIIQKENLADCVYLKGRLSNDKLKLYYQASDLFILPSEELEGFGLVTLEALASGLPVAATPIGGTIEILKDLRESLIFEGTSSDAIADGILKLLKNLDELRILQKKCRNYIINNFSWTKIALQIESLFKEVGEYAIFKSYS